MRTNIDIDSELMEKAMKAAGTRTKKATIDEALRLYVRTKGRGDLRELFGAVQWEGDLEQSRLNRLPDDAWTR